MSEIISAHALPTGCGIYLHGLLQNNNKQVMHLASVTHLQSMRAIGDIFKGKQGYQVYQKQALT